MTTYSARQEGFGPDFSDRRDIFKSDDGFYEESEPDFGEPLGAFKTTNPEGDRFHRQMIHTESKKSKFKKTVELVLCVHGWKNPDKEDPMTLVVLGVNLSCHTQDFRFQAVRIWLTFGEDNQADPPHTAEARPIVVAYAPFVRQQCWNPSTADVTKTRSYGGTLGADYIVAAEGNVNSENTISYTRKYFDKGSADRLYDEKTGRIYGIEWYCEQNNLQEYGVKPNFHIAVLLKRSLDQEQKPVSFKAEFDMQIEAGFIEDFKSGLRRAWRLNKPEDDPVYFDPSRTPVVYGVAGIGEELLGKVDADNLGALAEGSKLSKLLDPVGTSLDGLDPMSPM